jgi:hypothetical protein
VQYYDPTEDFSEQQVMATPKKKQRKVLSAQDKENIFFIGKNRADTQREIENKENIDNLNFMKKISVGSIKAPLSQNKFQKEASTKASRTKLGSRRSSKTLLISSKERVNSKPKFSQVIFFVEV